MRPKINILYADDDAIAVELLKRQVGTDDFCVKIASDGQKAWELFQSHVPDILLLDIKMPYLDGLDIIKLVRKINQKTPIVVYSSHLNTSWKPLTWVRMIVFVKKSSLICSLRS
ncbi:response regulator [Butyricimonas virosa]|uniref:response regulator n=1 Tax=Butyricimonas virosa TaxID=544645 RepID=UPI00242DF3CF|nr:response regulator [Butyricimonas virosa]